MEEEKTPEKPKRVLVDGYEFAVGDFVIATEGTGKFRNLFGSMNKAWGKGYEKNWVGKVTELVKKKGKSKYVVNWRFVWDEKLKKATKNLCGSSTLSHIKRYQKE